MYACRYLILTILTRTSAQDLCPKRPGKMPEFCTSFHIEVTLNNEVTPSSPLPHPSMMCSEEEKQFMNEKLEFYISKFARLFFKANDLRLNNPLLEIAPSTKTILGTIMDDAPNLTTTIHDISTTLPHPIITSWSDESSMTPSPLHAIEFNTTIPDDDFLSLNSSDANFLINRFSAVNNTNLTTRLDPPIANTQSLLMTSSSPTGNLMTPMATPGPSSHPLESAQEDKDTNGTFYDDDFIILNSSAKVISMDGNQTNTSKTGSPIQPLSDKGPMVARPVSIEIPSNIPTGTPTFPRIPIFIIQTRLPTKRPSNRPTHIPTRHPTKPPTRIPTPRPTRVPTKRPTNYPTKVPTNWPTRQPTKWPTRHPTNWPTKQPTNWPTKQPTNSLTKQPTDSITKQSTIFPTKQTTDFFKKVSTDLPTKQITDSLTKLPTELPTKQISNSPTAQLTASLMQSLMDSPTKQPKDSPIAQPTDELTQSPTDLPTKQATDSPTVQPIDSLTQSPTDSPTELPKDLPTAPPTHGLTQSPTNLATKQATDSPTAQPVDSLTQSPTDSPTEQPKDSPTAPPTHGLTQSPTDLPTKQETDSLTRQPTNSPIKQAESSTTESSS